jgi:arylsulfatase A-like enzyme
MSDKLPNLLIFVPDQWRGDVLGHMGNSGAITPNLDRLVETEAVSFRNSFVQSPVCTTSRCSFMTGWYPHVRGHRTMHYMLQPDEPMLLRNLKQAGYLVWWGGKNDVVPAQYGYEPFCDVRFEEEYSPKRPVYPNLHTFDSWRGDPQGDNFYSFYRGKIEKPADFPPDEPFVYDEDWHRIFGAVDFIKSTPKDRPICIFLALGSPHPPYAVEDPWYSMIDRFKIPKRIPTLDNWDGKPSMLKGIYERQRLQTWTEERWTELRATYYGTCARTDHQFGLVSQALKEAGVYEDTAIFFFSDHGDFTGDYGLVEKTQNTFEDCLTRVPFIIKPPKDVSIRPHVSEALVELIDFPATVEDLTGITPKHTHFGRSLLPVLAGTTDEHRQVVFCEGGRIHGEVQAMEPMDESQGRKWLYWPRISLQHSEGPEHTKAVMCRTKEYKYVRRLYETDELYDLRSDPRELSNRIYDPELSEIRTTLREHLLTFLIETGDAVPFAYDRRERTHTQ